MPPTQPARSTDRGYSGVSLTFARQPMALTPADLDGADVAVLGAPFDLAVTYRPGTRFGPRAVRLAEDVGVDGRPSIELGIDPYEALSVVDYGDAESPDSDVLAAHAAIQARVGEILAAGAIPAVIGGDHSITLPILRALARHHGADGFSVLHFDTHADTGEIHGEDSLPDHGQPFSRAVQEGVLLAGNIVQIGLRGCWPFPHEFDRMREQGFRWYTMGQIDELGLRTVLDEAIAHVRERAPRTYLTVDVDSLDPAHAPGTGTPEPGGLSSRELLAAVRRIAREVELCGMDLVEVSPPYDVAGITALAGQRVIQEALGGIALRRSGRAARPARH
ncbi:MAG: agmatinase [Gaiellales bacterium]|jgi:agmatinase|nr:agmatinase [Gaiellales bacterium]